MYATSEAHAIRGGYNHPPAQETMLLPAEQMNCFEATMANPHGVTSFEPFFFTDHTISALARPFTCSTTCE